MKTLAHWFGPVALAAPGRRTAKEMSRKSLAAWFGMMVLVVAAPLASATEEARDAPPEFVAADKNGDGVLSMQEARAIPGLTELFTLVDEDHNGRLDVKEYRLTGIGGPHEYAAGL